ncbi:MAG: hypothetical protein ABI980_15505 [Nitrospirota bacterium]
MLDQSIGIQEAQQQMAGTTVRERLARFSSRELMEALMAADLAMGGTNEQRIERLLAASSSLDVMQFFHQDALQRVSVQPTSVEHHIQVERRLTPR